MVFSFSANVIGEEIFQILGLQDLFRRLFGEETEPESEQQNRSRSNRTGVGATEPESEQQGGSSAS